MANENEKNPSALEELRRLKRTDRIKSLDIHEPELHDFNAENIFHIDEEPEKKTIFGKRSARTHVKINENIFRNVATPLGTQLPRLHDKSNQV